MKKAKNALSLLLALVLVLTLASCGNNSAPSGGSESPSGGTETSGSGNSSSGEYDLTGVEPITIVATSALSTTHCCWEGFYQPFMERVEELSDGLVTFEYYLGGELVDGGKEYDALRDGVADVAMPLTPIYDTSRFPAGDVPQLPFLSSTSKMCSDAYVAMLESDEIIADGKTFYELYFEDNGVHFIAHNNPPGNALSTTTKDITTMTDYTGLVIRTSSRPQQFLAAELGMSAVNTTAYDLYDTLSRGTVDGGFQQIPDWASYGLDELYKYAIEGISFGHFTAGMGWNLDFWNSLPPVVQQIITDAANECRDYGCEFWDQKTEEVKATVESNGGTFVEFSDLPQDLQGKINAACVVTWEEYVRMLEESGVPGIEICQLWRDCMVDAGAEMIDGVDEVLEQLQAEYGA